MPFSSRFAAEPAVSLEKRRLCRLEIQVDRIIALGCSKVKTAVLIEFPIVEPHQLGAFRKASFPECSAACLSGKVKLMCPYVGHGEMTKYEVVHDETGAHGRPGRRRAIAVTKKRQLIPELTPICASQISREIPPFGTKVEMRTIVAGKLNLEAWLNELPTLSIGIAGSCYPGNADQQHEGPDLCHPSTRIASIIGVRDARMAGSRPPRIATGRSNIVFVASSRTGITSGTVHPKKALLITSVRT